MEMVNAVGELTESELLDHAHALAGMQRECGAGATDRGTARVAQGQLDEGAPA